MVEFIGEDESVFHAQLGHVVTAVELSEEGHEVVLRQAVRANIANSVEQLILDSAMLAELVREDDLLVVGAQYCLERGTVEFF